MASSLFANKPVAPVIDVTPVALTISAAKSVLDFQSMSGQELVLFGNEVEQEISNNLNTLLSEITKGSSPLVFSLFEKLKKGVDGINIKELEEKIRASQKGGFFERIGLSSVAKRLAKANEEVGTMLTSKSKTLLDLIQSMEKDTAIECQKLVDDTKKMAQLSQVFKDSIGKFKAVVDTGKVSLDAAQNLLAAKKADAESGDPIKIQEYKEFEQKVNLFENRLLVLETGLATAPVELESIALSQQASLQTLAETVSGGRSAFNSVKSSLIKISVAHQIGSVQGMNQEREKLKTQLSQHSTTILGEVAVAATQNQGINRLNDANNLLNLTTNLKSISDKVASEKLANEKRREEARQKLEQTRKLLSV